MLRAKGLQIPSSVPIAFAIPLSSFRASTVFRLVGVATVQLLRGAEKNGFTMVSILAAISSAGMRLGVLKQAARGSKKRAQAAVVASIAASTRGAIP